LYFLRLNADQTNLLSFPTRRSSDLKAMEEIKEQLLDDTFMTSLAGTSRDYAESSGNTAFAFVLALILIYLILAAQFESFIDPLTDRKSTRLNSSHVKISYAVFCLKK